MSPFLPQQRSLISAFLLSLTIWGLAGVSAWALMVAVWPNQPHLVQGILVITAAGIGLALPSAPAGLGPYEAAVIGVLLYTGEGPTLSRTFAVLLHVTAILLTSTLGGLGLLREGVNFRDLAKQAREIKGVPYEESNK